MAHIVKTYEIEEHNTIDSKLDLIIEQLKLANSKRDEIIAILQDFYMDNKKEGER